MTRDELVKFVKDETLSRWQESQWPLYLADIPSLLREKQSIDYKNVIGDERLKSFSETTSGSNSYTVVRHPFQKAKIGLIPPGENFEFPDNATNTFDPPINVLRIETPDSRSHKVTLDFLKVISTLPADEQASIIIPTHIIAKLLHPK